MTEEVAEKKKPLESPHVWTSTTYFAEGFPYAVVVNLADVYFAEHGATLKQIGLTSLFHLPWNLKFLWSPFLDEYATKRSWIVAIEAVLAVLLVVLALSSAGPAPIVMASVVFVALGFVSATHDVAIDGFYLEAHDAKSQARFVGYRAPAYRLAMLLVSGPLLILIKQVGWSSGFGICGGVMLLLFAYHAVFLPRTEVLKKTFGALFTMLVRSKGLVVMLALAGGAYLAWDHLPPLPPLPGGLALPEIVVLLLVVVLVGMMLSLDRIKARFAAKDSFYAKAFVDFLDQPHVGRILAFVLLFRAGESFLMKMKYPFFKTLGMTVAEYGFANGTIGMIAGLIAPAVGGWLIGKHGLRRWIWPFALLQNVLHLLYVLVAMWLVPSSANSLSILTVVIAIETIGAGLGTAVFMVFMMRCCRPGFKAAHMAILTALMSVSFTLAGMVSGYLAEAMGFAAYFAFTLVVAVPGMALIPFLPHVDEPKTELKAA